MPPEVKIDTIAMVETMEMVVMERMVMELVVMEMVVMEMVMAMEMVVIVLME